MLETKPLKLFLKYAIPSIFGLLAVSSASIVDGLFIGNYVGSIGLAAINISLPLISFLIGLSLMFSVGSSVMVGKLLGEKNLKEASNLFTKAIVGITFFSIFSCLILYLNLENILTLLHVTGELKNITITYLSCIFAFIPFLMIGITLDYFVRVDENPNLAFVALFSSALLNVILDYVFIVVYNYGILGAAFATGISQLILIIVLSPHFISNRSTLKFVKPNGSWIKLLQAVKNGFSEFVNESSVATTILIFNYVMIKTYGVEGVAAYTIVEYTLWLSIMVNFAISDSMQPIISKNYGAKQKERISEFLKIASYAISFVAIILVSLVFLAPDFLINLFLKDDEIASKLIAREFISYVWPAFLVSGFNLLITAYLTAIHKPLPSASIAILRSLILPVFFVVTLPLILGTKGIFISVALAEILTLFVALYLFSKNSTKSFDF